MNADIKQTRGQKKTRMAGAQKNSKRLQSESLEVEVKRGAAALRRQQAARQALAQARRADSLKQKNDEIEEEIIARIPKKVFWKTREFMLSMLAGILVLLGVGVFVKINLPDISVKVAALQNGFDAKFPSYIPAGYKSTTIKTEKGRIILQFEGKEEQKFQITEERSSWDSATVLSGIVKEDWGDDYDIMKGQGLTIYIHKSEAVWVNGGVLYRISSSQNNLTQEQLHGIIISL